jgi:hypothetical protein
MSTLLILPKASGGTVSAAEFNALVDSINQKYDADSVVNNLLQGTPGKLLDAQQGKELLALVNAIRGNSALTIPQIATQLDVLTALVTGSTNDADSVVNTIQEILTIFSQYPEGVSLAQALALKATVDSPTFTGTPSAPTPAQTDNSTRIATTAFVKALVNAISVTSPTYDVTTGTRDAVQAAITNAPAGKRITLAPIDYVGFTGSNPLEFKNKQGVSLEGGRGANFISTGGLILLFNGDNLNSRLAGVNFSSTAASGSSQGLILITEQGVQDGLEIDKCRFTAPNLLANAITASTYSVAANGGSGQGRMTRKLKVHDCDFDAIGRCAIELVNHSWDDSKTNVYLQGLQINDNFFNDLGRKAETYDATVFNGMAVSISGYCRDVQVSGNQITDAKLLGIELAGTDGAVVSNNILRTVNNTYVGISVSDNQHKVTNRINILGNNVDSKVKCIVLNGVSNFDVTGNDCLQTVASTDASSVYFQNCIGGTFSGGTVNSLSSNAVRLDDSSKILISGMRLINKKGNTALVSIYGGSGSGSTYNKVGADMYYEKLSGVATTGVVEAYGSLQSNNSGVL